MSSSPGEIDLRVNRLLATGCLYDRGRELRRAADTCPVRPLPHTHDVRVKLLLRFGRRPIGKPEFHDLVRHDFAMRHKPHIAEGWTRCPLTPASRPVER